MAQITDMICDNMEAWLLLKMKTEIDSEDLARAVLVQVGNLHLDPVTNHIYLLVHPNDPDDTDWKHSIASGANSDSPYSGDVYREIGGGSVWIRRFSVDLGCYLTTQGYDGDTAREHSYTALGRLEKNITECTTIQGITDSFGETAHEHNVFDSMLDESGGPPTSFIHRGKVRFEVLTGKAY